MRIEAKDITVMYPVGDIKNIGFKDYFIQIVTHNRDVREFWALKGISFSLAEGDMLGIIGSNGAGKSTLLKVVSGIMRPTKGSIRVDGNVAALLELGSGFDAQLTVRENTYLLGAMMGYTRQFMHELYGDIIAFAELDDFQDLTFQKLSSGMKSRLAFSIASLVKPDILILDEVLSVGDAAFQKKSGEKMMEIINGGSITLFVSHSLDQIRVLCNKVLWIEKGEQIAYGETQTVCDQYAEFMESKLKKI